MILNHKISLDKISRIGKDYKWPKQQCEKCHQNMWGHGYVLRYFALILSAVYLKRYRCPCCCRVVTIRPEGYWPGIRSSIFTIYEALREKLCTGRWPFSIPRQRGGHWLKRFVNFARMEIVTNLSSYEENQTTIVLAINYHD